MCINDTNTGKAFCKTAVFGFNIAFGLTEIVEPIRMLVNERIGTFVDWIGKCRIKSVGVCFCPVIGFRLFGQRYRNLLFTAQWLIRLRTRLCPHYRIYAHLTCRPL
jgi:hypothetical protein